MLQRESSLQERTFAVAINNALIRGNGRSHRMMPLCKRCTQARNYIVSVWEALRGGLVVHWTLWPNRRSAKTIHEFGGR